MGVHKYHPAYGRRSEQSDAYRNHSGLVCVTSARAEAFQQLVQWSAAPVANSGQQTARLLPHQPLKGWCALGRRGGGGGGVLAGLCIQPHLFNAGQAVLTIPNPRRKDQRASNKAHTESWHMRKSQ